MTHKEKESYYKILGTTANIGNARIKEKYIQALKKHPPETDPEGFEKVREAYETLRDPEKRAQYDLMRKYGADVENILDNAFYERQTGNLEKAEKLLKRANKISPDNPVPNIGLSLIAIEKGDLDKMRIHFNHAMQKLSESDTEEKAMLYATMGTSLIEADFIDEALELLENGREELIDNYKTFALVLATAYAQAGRKEEAWDVINVAVPTAEEEMFDDIHFFITWSDMMLHLGIWKDKSKVQTRFRKFLKNLQDEMEKDIAYDILHESYEELYDLGMYQEAEFYIDLMRQLDNQNRELIKMRNKTRELARVQKDLDRLEADEDVFPLIFLQAFEWFYEDIIPDAELEEMKNSLSLQMLEELYEENEWHAAGILRLRKKYPIIYKHFKEGWDQIFDELTEGFNREMKRELRRLR